MQEMREALSFDPDIDSDNDEEEYNGGRQVHHRNHRNHPVEEGSDPEVPEPHEKGERRCPRLCLDDALILVYSSRYILLCSLQTSRHLQIIFIKSSI
jgi:hypothetical protein